MDSNNNPISTSNPTPDSVPNLDPNVVLNSVSDSVSSPDASPAPNPVVNLVSNPIVNPTSNPVANPVANMDLNSMAPGSVSQSINPIVNPGGGSVVSGATNPVFQPEGITPTTPILASEPAQAPDPVKEELETPMKAADPVPGSIGSAVSGPAENPMTGAVVENPFARATDRQIPSVSFNDPATQPENMVSVGSGASAKKTNRMALIALIAVAAIVVVALAAVLIIQLINNKNTVQTSTPNEPTVLDIDDGGNVNANNVLSCTRNMTQAEVVKYNDAVSGMINISAEFGGDDELTMISLVESIIYSDEDSANNEPVENLVHESSAEDLTPASALNFYLRTDDTGNLDLTKNAIQSNYESLDYTCEVL